MGDAVRTLIIDNDDRLEEAPRGVYSGAITALSDPAAEFQETADKAAPLLRLLDAPFPEDGLPANQPVGEVAGRPGGEFGAGGGRPTGRHRRADAD